jgi:hypothetical protein
MKVCDCAEFDAKCESCFLIRKRLNQLAAVSNTQYGKRRRFRYVNPETLDPKKIPLRASKEFGVSYFRG